MPYSRFRADHTVVSVQTIQSFPCSAKNERALLGFINPEVFRPIDKVRLVRAMRAGAPPYPDELSAMHFAVKVGGEHPHPAPYARVVLSVGTVSAEGRMNDFPGVAHGIPGHENRRAVRVWGD